MIPMQVVFFIGPDGTPSATLGYTILSDAGTRQGSRPAGIGG
jgi:hypothetical protein